MQYYFFDKPLDFTKYILNRLTLAYNEAINTRGVFHIVLPGGNTPIPLFRELRAMDFDWSTWNIWMADERCVEKDDYLSNCLMLQNELIAHLPFHKPNIHLMEGHLGPVEGAKAYHLKLLNAPIFNFVLLGIGEDGHIASLFPGNEWGMDQGAADAIAVYKSPKHPKERISLSANRLSKSEQIVFLAAGENKKEIIRQISNNEHNNSPVSFFFANHSTTLVYCTVQKDTEI